jgi:[ribosomal protein S5]-alanine N-acetyltransferase
MIATERLIIRPFVKNDYRDFYEYMSREEVYRFERGKPLKIKEAVNECKKLTRDDRFWAITLKENGKLIGQVTLTPNRPKEFRMWNLGYMMNPDFQNKGYATEAARAMIKYGFTELNAHRIVGHCDPDNTASWKVLEKCGMKKEGMSRKDFPVRTDEEGNTIWLDSLDYGILDEDFK